ncbi:MAG: tetratricopeptide repeat protein, partial [Planctomycetes bacterium]|nr:tetratricopeptide repeat protein [Planctomycetota bacterium]
IARRWGDFRAWPGTRAGVLAGRLASQLGDNRLGVALFLRAGRRDPKDPEARCYYAEALLRSRGTFETWRFLRESEVSMAAPPRACADWFGLRARIASFFRDFDDAERWLARAEAAAPDHPWIAVERSAVMERADRHDESLDAARRSLSLRAWYAPGVLATARALILLERESEALELLVDASARLESAAVVGELGQVQMELGLHQDARRSFERFAELSPLMDRFIARWLAGQRSDAAYHCGDIPEATEFARLAGGPFYVALVDRLANAATPTKRKVLSVSAVHQRHMTCSPATLSAISRYWSMPTDHVAVADAICYDGTPDHSQRIWAERNGWVAREFTLDWETARSLLDRGLPFTVSTVEPTSAHSQAVIGYDERRATLLFRDPSECYAVERRSEAFFARYVATGPRAMVFVPADHAPRLDETRLPDADLFDLYHRVQATLEKHDLDAARDACRALAERAPDHRLTLYARHALCAQEFDFDGALACIERLLERYPGNERLLLIKLGCLRALARHADRLALLDEQCVRWDRHPAFLQLRAQEMTHGESNHEAVIRSLRRWIGDGTGCFALAISYWRRRELDVAAELHRLASCLDDTDESYARAYFDAALRIRRHDEALEHLRARVRRFAKKSGRPATTLFGALSDLARDPEAFEALESALDARADDVDLLLFAAERHARCGQLDRARALLERGVSLSPGGPWHRAAAAIAWVGGEDEKALSLWRDVLAKEPAALDAHRAIAQIRRDTLGSDAATAYLRDVAAAFPRHRGIQRLWAEWSSDVDRATAEAPVRRFVELDPMDAWARRELAWILIANGRLDEAATELDLAKQLDAASPFTFNLVGRLFALRGNVTESNAAYREAIRIAADTDYAVTHLLQQCTSPAERRGVLAFLWGEVQKQHAHGDSVFVYCRHAKGVVDSDELLASVRALADALPDRWECAAALYEQLREMGRADESADVAADLARKFPMLPRAWVELGRSHLDRGRSEEARVAISRALEISPRYAAAARRLAEVHEKAGDLEAARRVLERAVALGPLDPANHGCLADVLWLVGEKDAAIEHLSTAVRLDPDYGWAWESLQRRAQELSRPEVPGNVARDLTLRRPRDARAFLLLADTLSDPGEALAALDRAIELDPQNAEAHDRRAATLVDLARFDEALAACRPPALAASPPVLLRGREAWVTARKGDLTRAITLMRDVVSESADYFWGWRQLAEWYDSKEEFRDSLLAAEQMARIRPENATSHGYVADGKRKTGDRAGAKDACRRAVEIAPDYAFAGLVLFDLQFEDEQFDDAAATLKILEEHVGGPLVLARQVKLHAARRNFSAALEAFGKICSTASDDAWPCRTSIDALFDAHQVEPARAALLDSAKLPTFNATVAVVWLERLAAKKRWIECDRFVDDMSPHDVAWPRVASRYLELLVPAERGIEMRRYVRRNRERLRRYPQSWGSVGYALHQFDLDRAAVKWLSDWRSREGLQPWMLLNLVGSLRELRRLPEARRVSEAALEITPVDYATADHKLWLAFDEAARGDVGKADERLRGVEPTALNAWYRTFFSLTRVLIDVSTAAPPDFDRAFERAKKELDQVVAQLPTLAQTRLVRRAYRICVLRIARRRGGIAGWAWAAFRIADLLASRT